jgi:manganese/iron transport system permease protein
VHAALLSLPEPFDTPFMQRALLEVLMLAVLGGLLGSWIVLRRMAFFTHGVGTAAFPGLVIAGPAGVAPQLAALGAALAYAGGVEGLRRTRRVATDAATGLVLVGALALGVVLASDVFETSAGVDRLLFGSLIGLTDRDLWLTAGVLVAVAVLEAGLRRSWLAQGFDPATARSLGIRVRVGDALLLLAVAGAADLVSAVYRQSILQTYAPDRLRGRLQGVHSVVVVGGPRLGDLRAGATAAWAGPQVSWAGGGFAAAGLAVVLALAFPALVRYRPPDEPPPTR